MKQWINETLHNDYRQSFSTDKVLFDNKSAHQHIQIIETTLWGRVMLLDGVVQTTEKDEFIYHEMFAHIPAIAHQNPKNILIIGGGDGGLLREILKHPTVTQVTLVEIDAKVIEMCSKYLPNHSQNCWEDSRVKVVIDDGSAFIKNCATKFDLILSDSTDPIGPGAILFEPSFYQNAINCLTEDGILVTQNGVSFLQLAELKSTYQHLSNYSKFCGFYTAAVPTYIGGNMNLAWASNKQNLAKHAINQITNSFNDKKIKTKYYNPKIHLSSFALPQYVLDFCAISD